ncbi:HAMP domain-containing protein [Affinibrenneria salicis]|uniref:HAMP domain-containing protein n=1 Tax=Affinibrenneria salicis TaxID=2590031 RepID=A0A5J5FTY2_9GAMM|nr:methyl-accepting chemotaxis protein [Affinibrenneria salicis]KAA8996674.1 HAMP domain-containing protein [Affinibrenneria salicis]
MFRALSIRTGLLILLTLMALLLLSVSTVGIMAINNSYSALNAVNLTQGTQLGNLASSNTNMQRIRVVASLSVRNMEVNKPQEAAAGAGRAAQYADTAREELQRFLAAAKGTGQGEVLANDIDQAWQAYFSQGIQPMLEALNKQDISEYYYLTENRLRPLGTAFDKANKAFFDYAQQTGQQQLEKASSDRTRMLLIIGVCGLLTIVLILLAWVVLRKMLLTPLNTAIRHLEFVSSGDLTQTLPESGDNELGRLNAALQSMQQSLAASVTRVRDACMQIDVGSRELALGNDDLSRRTEVSASSLEQTAASMEQLTATVKHNADNAEQGHQLAAGVADIANHGNKVVQDVMNKMKEISQSANSIGSILSVIDGIAFQTNILALNAAVEAARAGEQGRGFAVVANEVRTLAQRSAQASKEIHTLIADSNQRVNEGTQLTTQAGETMSTIAEQIVNVNVLIKEISHASKEQSHGIDQINVAVNQMEEVAQQNAALVEESATATRSLEEQTRQLIMAMSSFKVDDSSLVPLGISQA